MDKKYSKHIVNDMRESMDEFRKVIEQFYDLSPKEVEFPIQYDGQEITHSCITHCSPNIKEDLTKESLKYHSDRGRDALDMLLTKVFQLGYQSGYVTRKEETDLIIECQKSLIEGFKKELKIKS